MYAVLYGHTNDTGKGKELGDIMERGAVAGDQEEGCGTPQVE